MFVSYGWHEIATKLDVYSAHQLKLILYCCYICSWISCLCYAVFYYWITSLQLNDYFHVISVEMTSKWEVFTLPPYSTWNPHGIHMDSRQFQVDSIHSIWNMFWLRSHPFWLFHSTFIPYGIHLEWSYSITFPSFHMECPYGIHMECLWNNSITIPWNGHGFHMEQ